MTTSAVSVTIRGLAAGAVIASVCGWAGAQYPTKPTRYVVPYPPGGPLDIVARIVGQKLSARLGQPVIVDNRPGAGGNIGADMVAKAPPDGYTLVMGAVATHAINPHLYRKLPYDPVRDFTPITLITQVPNVLVVHPSLPVRTVRDLIALAKARPGALNFGSGSTGSAGHLAGELFKVMAGVDMVHVPYKGAAPAVADLLGGQIQLMFDNLASAAPNVRAGKLRAIAVTTERRSPQLPELPTIAESGLPGFDVSTWFGVFAPVGIAPEVLARLSTELAAILAMADVKAQLANLGAEPAALSPQQFAAFVRRELAKYEKVVKASGAKVD